MKFNAIQAQRELLKQFPKKFRELHAKEQKQYFQSFQRGPLPEFIHTTKFEGYDEPPSWLELPESWEWKPAESWHHKWEAEDSCRWLATFYSVSNPLCRDWEAESQKHSGPVALEFDNAKFTFANASVAARYTAAIERIRAGRFLEKDLPRHVKSPCKSLRAVEEYRSRESSRPFGMRGYQRQIWSLTDQNGHYQTHFPEDCWIGSGNLRYAA